MDIPKSIPTQHHSFIKQTGDLLITAMKLNSIPEDGVLSENLSAIKNATGFNHRTEITVNPHGNLIRGITVRAWTDDKNFMITISRAVKPYPVCKQS